MSAAQVVHQPMALRIEVIEVFVDMSGVPAGRVLSPSIATWSQEVVLRESEAPGASRALQLHALAPHKRELLQEGLGPFHSKPQRLALENNFSGHNAFWGYR